MNLVTWKELNWDLTRAAEIMMALEMGLQMDSLSVDVLVSQLEIL